MVDSLAYSPDGKTVAGVGKGRYSPIMECRNREDKTETIWT